MRRRFGLLIFVVFLGALVGCDDDDSHYVAPYDVCAAHHGDATACRAEPGCRVEDMILRARFDQDRSCLFLYPDTFCIPDLPAKPPPSMADDNGNAPNQEVEGECSAATTLADGSKELFWCPRCGECKPFFDLGWSPDAGWCDLAPIIDPGCLSRTSMKDCITSPVPNVLHYYDGKVGCVWLEQGYTVMRYTDGMCEIEREEGASCVAASWRGDLMVNTSGGGPDMEDAPFHDHRHELALAIRAIDATSVVSEGWSIVTEHEGDVRVWARCPSDSTSPECSCTLDATDATGT